ncbi:hypothetical protein KA005_46275, partial [bacterium]|nr:hypothetical protein [bacterium]
SENHPKTGNFSGCKASLEKKRLQTLAETFFVVDVAYPTKGLWSRRCFKVLAAQGYNVASNGRI